MDLKAPPNYWPFSPMILAQTSTTAPSVSVPQKIESPMNQIKELGEKIKVDLQRHFGRPICNSHLYWCLGYDLLFGQIVVAPLYAMTWYGTWTVLDYAFDILVFEENYQASGIFSLIFGCLGSIPYLLFHRTVQDFAQNGSTLRYLFISRLFTVTNFYFDLFVWKGIWGLFDHVIGPHWKLSTSVLGVSLFLLVVFQYPLRVLSPPMRFSIDRSQDYFHMSTVMETSPANPIWQRLLDAILTLGISILSILTFYGIWSLADIYYDDFDLPFDVQGRNYFHSMLAGYLCVALVLVLQCLCLLSHSTDIREATLADSGYILNRIAYGSLLIIAIWGDVLVFRGLYCIFDIYFLYNNRALSAMLSQFGGVFLMMFFYVSSNLHGGLASEGVRQKRGILLDNFYLTYLLSKHSDEQLLAPNSLSLSSGSEEDG